MRARPAQRDLELGAEERERGPQFVARVRDEAALVLDGGFEAVEHVVQCLGQPAHLVARSRDGVERVEQGLPAAHGIVGDVSRKEDIHPITMQIVGALGGVDVLINNASDLGPIPLQLLADTECEDLERALATNFLGPFRLTKAMLGSLAASARECRGAVVVNVSSDAAVNAYQRWGAYSASKAALLHLSRIWDEELSLEGVRVLSIDPGDMDTPLHAAAVPDADRSTLKSPEVAARELADTIAAVLSQRRRTNAIVQEAIG